MALTEGHLVGYTPPQGATQWTRRPHKVPLSGLHAPTRCHLVEPVPFSATPSDRPFGSAALNATPPPLCTLLVQHTIPYIAWPVLANTITNCGGQIRCAFKVQFEW